MTPERRLSFGSAADLYDRMRPSYPAELVEDILAFAETRPGEAALEIGAGTGKATRLFAERDLAVQALEPSPEMAALARSNCRGFPDVSVEEAEFERWEPGGATFAIVYAAQAWHWIDPAVRYRKPADLLRKGGALAAFWNRPDWSNCVLAADIDSHYRAVIPELLEESGPMRPSRQPMPELWGDPPGEIAATGRYEAPVQRRYTWRRRYSTEEYLSLLQTHSDHILLAEDRRRALLRGVGAIIDLAGGAIEIDYVTHLTLARAR